MNASEVVLAETKGFDMYCKSLLSAKRRQQMSELRQIVMDWKPEIHPGESVLAKFLRGAQLSNGERSLFALALSIHISPQSVSHYLQDFNKEFKEHVGVAGKNYGGLVPNGLAWLLIASGGMRENRVVLMGQIKDNRILSSGIVKISGGYAAEPFLNGVLVMDEQFLFQLLTDAPLHIRLD